MSLYFNHANTVETDSSRNGEKLVEASSTKRRTRLGARYGSYLASWFRDVPFQLHSVFSGAFPPKIPGKFVMQIDFQRSDSSCSSCSRKTYPAYSFIIKPSAYPGLLYVCHDTNYYTDTCKI